MEQLAANPLKSVLFVLVMVALVLGYVYWFNRKPVEYKRANHKKVGGVFILAVAAATYLFFPSDVNMTLLILGVVLLYMVNARLVHYCQVCGRVIRTNIIKQTPEKCPYCHSLYTPPK